MKMTFARSAFKHEYSSQDLDEVLDATNPTTKEWAEGFGKIGERVLFVGFNSQAELLEIIVEYVETSSEDAMIVFHIDKCSKENRKRFHEQR